MLLNLNFVFEIVILNLAVGRRGGGRRAGARYRSDCYDFLMIDIYLSVT
jgi:hypothetical protein